MTQARSTSQADLWFGTFLVAVCAIVLWESRDIPPGTFEPLGSAPVPRAVALLIIALTLIVMARAWFALRPNAVGPASTDPAARLGDAAMIAALTIAYALALHLRLARFDVLTSIYLFASIGLLVRFERRKLPYVASVALVTGFGCQYVFTRVFVVDLPGAF